MIQEIKERIQKSNDQRIKMALTLINVLKNTKESTLELRAAVATSVFEMLTTSMLPEDNQLVHLLNDAVDFVCKEIEDAGVSNFKDRMVKIIKDSQEKSERVVDGESILNNINLN